MECGRAAIGTFIYDLRSGICLEVLNFSVIGGNWFWVPEIMGGYGCVVDWAMKVLEILKLVQIVQNGRVYMQLMKQYVPWSAHFLSY